VANTSSKRLQAKLVRINKQTLQLDETIMRMAMFAMLHYYSKQVDITMPQIVDMPSYLARCQQYNRETEPRLD
jgi:hypothetical protein